MRIQIAALSLFLAGSLLVVSAVAATKVYRTVDKDGNVIFTDVPPERLGDDIDPRDTQIVDVSPANTYSPSQRRTAEDGRQLWIVDDPAAPGGEEEAESQVVYRSLEITSPANDQAVRANDGNVSISASIQPELSPAHKIRLTVDGQTHSQGPDTFFTLTNMNRGTHTAIVSVIDETGTPLISSPRVTFHVLRAHR